MKYLFDNWLYFFVFILTPEGVYPIIIGTPGEICDGQK
jgi:hypothetical protein